MYERRGDGQHVPLGNRQDTNYATSGFFRAETDDKMMYNDQQHYNGEYLSSQERDN
jgi:hypothetical protein